MRPAPKGGGVLGGASYLLKCGTIGSNQLFLGLHLATGAQRDVKMLALRRFLKVISRP